MKQRRRGPSRSWTRGGSVTASAGQAGTVPSSNGADEQAETRLGPYEARYEIALGYSTERPIITG